MAVVTSWSRNVTMNSQKLNSGCAIIIWTTLLTSSWCVITKKKSSSTCKKKISTSSCGRKRGNILSVCQRIHSPQTDVSHKAAGRYVNIWLILYIATMVQVWKGENGPLVQDQLEQILTGGYAALLSAGYYLDVQIPNVNQTWYLALGKCLTKSCARSASNAIRQMCGKISTSMSL